MAKKRTKKPKISYLTIDLREYVSRYVALSQADMYWKGDCPFEGCESDDTFMLSDHLHIWHCTSCKRNGDIVGFVAHKDVCSREEAYKKLLEELPISCK